MKTIGRTDNGDHIVTCTEGEMKMYSMLVKVASGARIPGYYMDPRDTERFDADVAAALKAVLHWIEVKDKANALRLMADQIDAPIAPNE